MFAVRAEMRSNASSPAVCLTFFPLELSGFNIPELQHGVTSRCEYAPAVRTHTTVIALDFISQSLFQWFASIDIPE
jgi:hypothetical protein